MLEQMRVDEFLKEGKDIKITNGNTNGNNLAVIEDEDVDIPSDDGEGSDISDAMAPNIDVTSTIKPQGRQKPMVTAQAVNQKQSLNERKLAAEKKERSLLANTVTVAKQREPRSSKTARIYSYGSLLADDDEDEDEGGPMPEGDDDEDIELSKSEEIAKMSDSEIDLDAIDSDVESTGSANLNLSDDFAPQGPTAVGGIGAGGRSKPQPGIPNAAKLTTKFSFDKSDDNF